MTLFPEIFDEDSLFHGDGYGYEYEYEYGSGSGKRTEEV
jgi:hypothetical protein